MRWFPMRRVRVPCWSDIQDVDLKTLFKCGANVHCPTNERIDGVPWRVGATALDSLFVVGVLPLSGNVGDIRLVADTITVSIE